MPDSQLPVSFPAVSGRAFISYVREDSGRVDRLQRALEAAGVPVWRDTADLWPGQDWRKKIRRAITDNALVFIACFSSQSVARKKSYQNEELALAIEQLRLRQPDDPWLIPIRLDDCNVPDLDIGASRTLGSIQRADLFGDRYEAQMRRLIEIVKQLLAQSPPDREAGANGANSGPQPAPPPRPTIRSQRGTSGQREDAATTPRGSPPEAPAHDAARVGKESARTDWIKKDAAFTALTRPGTGYEQPLDGAELSAYAEEAARLREANRAAETSQERRPRLYNEAIKRAHSHLTQPLMAAFEAAGLQNMGSVPENFTAWPADAYGGSTTTPCFGIETLRSPLLIAAIGVLRELPEPEDTTNLLLGAMLATVTEHTQHTYFQQVEPFRAGSPQLDRAIAKLNTKINTVLRAIISHYLTTCDDATRREQAGQAAREDYEARQVLVTVAHQEHRGNGHTLTRRITLSAPHTYPIRQVEGCMIIPGNDGLRAIEFDDARDKLYIGKQRIDYSFWVEAPRRAPGASPIMRWIDGHGNRYYQYRHYTQRFPQNTTLLEAAQKIDQWIRTGVVSRRWGK
jgi:hypothetical protein